MITSFQCKYTEELWVTGKSRKLPSEISRVALRKLLMLHNACKLRDLRSPPSNHLENLQGIRHEQYSIRINIRWRICFCWKDEHTYQVEIVDYN